LLARDAPNLLGVSLEENLVEAVAKTIGDPLLEVGLFGMRKESRLGIAQADQKRFDRPQTCQRVGGLERIIEEPLAIVNAREAGADQENLPQKLLPPGIDSRNLCEKPAPP